MYKKFNAYFWRNRFFFHSWLLFLLFFTLGPKSELVKFCDTTHISSDICYDCAELFPPHSAAVSWRYVLPIFVAMGRDSMSKIMSCSQLSLTSCSKGAG